MHPWRTLNPYAAGLITENVQAEINTWTVTVVQPSVCC